MVVLLNFFSCLLDNSDSDNNSRVTNLCSLLIDVSAYDHESFLIMGAKTGVYLIECQYHLICCFVGSLFFHIVVCVCCTNWLIPVHLYFFVPLSIFQYSNHHLIMEMWLRLYWSRLLLWKRSYLINLCYF